LVVKIVLVAAAIVALAVLFSMYNSGRTSAQQSQTVIQGSVKMTEIDLNSMLDGYIDAVNVEEGDEVKAGDVILQIEPDIVQAKVKEPNFFISFSLKYP
ncbi:MAG: biotin/lipoyl-binding protein, partial [Firmicutes bacterium]|nr:biotin/lipoyl-binding protein [Bacillota bacterium]